MASIDDRINELQKQIELLNQQKEEKKGVSSKIDKFNNEHKDDSLLMKLYYSDDIDILLDILSKNKECDIDQILILNKAVQDKNIAFIVDLLMHDLIDGKTLLNDNKNPTILYQNIVELCIKSDDLYNLNIIHESLTYMICLNMSLSRKISIVDRSKLSHVYTNIIVHNNIEIDKFYNAASQNYKFNDIQYKLFNTYIKYLYVNSSDMMIRYCLAIFDNYCNKLSNNSRVMIYEIILHALCNNRGIDWLIQKKYIELNLSSSDFEKIIGMNNLDILINISNNYKINSAMYDIELLSRYVETINLNLFQYYLCKTKTDEINKLSLARLTELVRKSKRNALLTYLIDSFSPNVNNCKL